MRLNEQDIINAICEHEASRKQLQPSQVEAQLLWEEDTGFSAEVTASGRSYYIIESTMLEALERYVLKYEDTRVFRSQIRLELEDEIYAVVDGQP